MIKKRGLLIVLFLAAFTDCGLLNGDDTPNIPGKIVFSAKDENENYQIYTMRANGSNLKQLTHFDESVGGAYSPSWSPDGRRIIFSASKQGTSAGPALWVMNANGSDKHVLYDPEPDNIHVWPLGGDNASWSPDGSKIIYDRCVACSVSTNVSIYVFNTETKEVTRLTELKPGISNSYPKWSPDGSKITFVSDREYPEDYAHDLYVMNVDESNLTRLTQTGNTREPVWNANEKIIAFRSTGASSGIYKIDIKTREIKQIKEDLTERVQLHPNSWSSDGKYLLITAWELDEPHTNTLYIFNMENNSLENVYSRTSKSTIGIQDADWFIPLVEK